MLCFLFLLQLHYFPWRWSLEVTGCIHFSSAAHWLVQHINLFSKMEEENKTKSSDM
jgi:hypothetical protein